MALHSPDRRYPSGPDQWDLDLRFSIVPLQIAVIGAGDAPASVEVIAEEVGAALAQLGAVVVCGGLMGVMGAACRGAKSAGGTTVGILPGSDPSAANPWVDIVIPTGLGEARNALVVRSAAAVIAAAGEFVHRDALVARAVAEELGAPLGTFGGVIPALLARTRPR